MKKNPYTYIVLAGIFWSTQGTLGKLLGNGLTPFQIAFSRVFIGFVLILALTLVNHRDEIKIDGEGMFKIAAMGIFCQGVNSICFFYSVSKISVAAATALMYTGPIFAVIVSRFVFSEKITKLKGIALVVSSVSCFLVVTKGDIGVFYGSMAGILAGTCSGFAFGVNGIIGKLLMRRYNSWVVLMYAFGFASLFMLPFCSPVELLGKFSNFNLMAGVTLLGITTSFLAFGSYFMGIDKGALPSKAGIVSTIEIAIAVMLAYIVFREPIGVIRLLGIVGIFAGMYILYLDSRNMSIEV
ncbi:Permease of the drug/metabolite transporter (DMT) superfamily [Peptoclostridium litorale DSM 5388]|uniref:EamA domain-containing protein n=1 Tax=Peptoclostridium litorale DSM 5388 TaxID=1121324 RepID=A0A069RP44_PEPLI|nr:DMT family transporter [Peptoclostridium litorale]KDR95947.1 hypothetical protein CLIT_8c01160 [Peptoclostridium litorale DSM 5388]SIO09419.1 Permease of the drug/metabolite transporter (DMT) superfamily [Peptoclostridium litorale DSM 5388]